MNRNDMKKLVVVTWFFPGQPGFLDYSYRIRSLAENYNVTVLSREPINQAELLTEKAEYKSLTTAGTSKRDMLRYQYAVRKEIQKSEPDGVVLLGSQIASLAVVLRCPTVVYWNEHPSHFADPMQQKSVKKWGNKLFYKLAYLGAKSATLVLPIGEAHRDDLIDMGVAREKVVMMYMGVHPMFQSAHLDRPINTEGKIRLIYTGSVEKARGRDVMLEGLALANAEKSIASLTIVGASDEQIQYCKAKARELGIANDVRVIGRVPGYEIPTYLQEADFGICIWEDRPCWRFNPPTKLFEYLVAGIPVMASDIRTHTQYIDDEVTGLIFSYSVEGFSKAVQRASRISLALLRRNARNGGERYLWSKIESEFILMITSCI